MILKNLLSSFLLPVFMVKVRVLSIGEIIGKFVTLLYSYPSLISFIVLLGFYVCG